MQRDALQLYVVPDALLVVYHPIVLLLMVEALEVRSAVSVDVAVVDVEVPVEAVLPLAALGGSSCARIGTCMSSLY